MSVEMLKKGRDRRVPNSGPVNNKGNQGIVVRAVSVGLCAAAVSMISFNSLHAKDGAGSGGRGTATSDTGSSGGGSGNVGSLKGISPLPRDVSEFIVDKVAAKQLGKALFWDIQAGSDGTACASCHYHSGADIRTKNQVDPGVRSVISDLTFGDANGLRADGTKAGPNKQFGLADFPFHQLKNIFNKDSAVTYDTNDIFSSQGTANGSFIAPVADAGGKFAPPPVTGSTLNANEACTHGTPDANTIAFQNETHTLQYRKVPPRNTPSNINAVFNYRNFWDGRANNDFNGVDPFGARTYQRLTTLSDGSQVGNPAAATTGILANIGGTLTLVQPIIPNSSLASQAVGPALSDFEMSCSNKSFADLGRKMLLAKPLADQQVHTADSALGNLSNGPGNKGLNTTYPALIQKAFNSKYWSSPAKDGHGYSQMEHNFSLFWGLAIQEYESSLVSDDSPFDRGQAALSKQEQDGLNVFNGKGNCTSAIAAPFFRRPGSQVRMLKRPSSTTSSPATASLALSTKDSSISACDPRMMMLDLAARTATASIFPIPGSSSGACWGKRPGRLIPSTPRFAALASHLGLTARLRRH